MTDELDRPDAAADGGEAGDGDTAGGHGQTAVATRPGDQPLRPTGKRSRHRAADAGDESDATELSEADVESEAGEAAKAKKAKKKPAEESRNPFLFVLNYLKQVVAELRKVIWPNRKQMVTYTSVVLAFLVFMVTLVAASDYGFAKLVLLVFGD